MRHAATVWIRGLLRLAGMVGLVLVLVLALGGTALAGENRPAQEPIPLDRLCVRGAVIDHEERPSTGWTITAMAYDASGMLDPTTARKVETDVHGTFIFDNLPPGLWNFTISAREGWEPVTADSFDVPIAYGNRDCQVIRFKMRRVVIVRVLKIDTDHNPLAGWTIRARPGPGNFFALPKEAVTGEDGIATFSLSPGMWIFTEVAPEGVVFDPVAPATGVQSLDVQPPGPYLLRFKNRLLPEDRGCIEVIKRDIPPEGSNQAPFGLPDWYIFVLRTDGSLAAEGFTDALGRIVFTDLPLGPYTVHEGAPPEGWEPAAPTSYQVVLTGPKCVQVEFYNRQSEPAFCIEGRKVDTNGRVGLPGWEITATPREPGGYTPPPVYTDGTGRFRIDFPMNDYRIPGATYQVCEVVPDGWLPQGPTCQWVTLPEQPGACVRLEQDFENQQVGRQPVDPPDPPAPPGCSAVHVVRAGEGLFAIGRMYGKSPQEMLSANPWVRKQYRWYLYRGQRVCIP